MADELQTKVGDMIRVCFPARKAKGGLGAAPAQLGHPVKVTAVWKSRRVKYMSNYGFPMTTDRWVRCTRKLRIAKFILPPESSTARMRMTRQEGSARSYG